MLRRQSRVVANRVAQLLQRLLGQLVVRRAGDDMQQQLLGIVIATGFAVLYGDSDGGRVQAIHDVLLQLLGCRGLGNHFPGGLKLLVCFLVLLGIVQGAALLQVLQGLLAVRLAASGLALLDGVSLTADLRGIAGLRSYDAGTRCGGCAHVSRRARSCRYRRAGEGDGRKDHGAL